MRWGRGRHGRVSTGGGAIRRLVRYWGRFGAWRSLVARTVRVGEVPSSNLGAPIAFKNREWPRIRAKSPKALGVAESVFAEVPGMFVGDWDRRGTAAAGETDRERAAAVRGVEARIPAVGGSPEIGLGRRVWWDALLQGGPEVLGEVLAPDAQWYGVEDGHFSDGPRQSSR